MTKTIFIATGGTGGHIIPARVLAAQLADSGYRVIVLGDEKYRRYSADDDAFSSKIINASQIKKNPLLLVRSSLAIGIGVLQSLYYFLRYRPFCVVGFGGYATFPVLVAAIIVRCKIILHEQNAHLGKVNGIFALYCDKIALTFAQTSGIALQYRERTTVVGNPVRDEIASLHHLDYKLPQKFVPKKSDKMGYNVVLASEFLENEKEDETFNILVIGGSGGAKIFSDILPRAIFNLGEEIKNSILALPLVLFLTICQAKLAKRIL